MGQIYCMVVTCLDVCIYIYIYIYILKILSHFWQIRHVLWTQLSVGWYKCSSDDGLLVFMDIVRSVVSVSVLTWFIRCIPCWNLNNVSLGICNIRQFSLSCLLLLVVLLSVTFRLSIWLSNLLSVLPEINYIYLMDMTDGAKMVLQYVK